jgi:hypothetical protein
VADTPTLERRRLSGLTPDLDNARRHSAANVEAIRLSLERFGQQRPLVIRPDGTIVAGNGTYQAAAALGWDELEVAVFTGTDDEARAFAIADNRTAELAAWNAELLREQLAELGELTAWTGFADLDLSGLRAPGEPEAAHATGIGTARSITEHAERYAARATRLLIFEYRADLYAWVTARMEEQRERFDSLSNADALVALLAERAGVPMPEVMG